MSSSQGFFESDSDYQARMALESDERTIQAATGSTPGPGFFESESAYRDRIRVEAAERTVEALSGTRPSPGFFESSSDYQRRVALEANESSVRTASGTQPSPGFFESSQDYDVRIRQEANEHAIRSHGGQPAPGWFEGAHDYRSRIAHEARELNVRHAPGQAPGNSPMSDPTASAAPSAAQASGGQGHAGGWSPAVPSPASSASTRVRPRSASFVPAQGMDHSQYATRSQWPPFWVIASFAVAGAVLPFLLIPVLAAATALLSVVAAVLGVIVFVAFALVGLRAGFAGLLVGAALGYFFGYGMVPAVTHSIGTWSAGVQADLWRQVAKLSLWGALMGGLGATLWQAPRLASALGAGGLKGRDLPIRLRWILLAAVAGYAVKVWLWK